MLFEQVANLTHGEGVAREGVGDPGNRRVEPGDGRMRITPLAEAFLAEGFNDVKPDSVNGGDRYQDSIRINLILPGKVAREVPYRLREMDLDYTKFEQPAGDATGRRAV